MKFDFGDVLVRMWKIGWNHKVLWLFQMLPGLLYLFMLPLFLILNPALLALQSGEYARYASETWVIALFSVSMLLLTLLLFVALALTQAAVTLGALKVEQGAERLSFGGLFHESKPFLLRIAGLYLLFGLGWMSVVLAFMALMMAAAFVTAGLGMLCMMPLFVLIYPIAFVGYIVLELAQAGLLAEDLGVWAAVTRGWRLFRANALVTSVMMLLLYIGLSTASGLIVFPMMIPMMSLPLSMDSSGQFNVSILPVMLGAFAVMAVVMSVVQGILMTFFHTAWAVTYLRLAHPTPEQPPVLPAEANA